MPGPLPAQPVLLAQPESCRAHPPQICWESCAAGGVVRQLAELDVCDSGIYCCCFCVFRSVRVSYSHKHPAYHRSTETGINYNKMLQCCFKSILTTVKKFFHCCFSLTAQAFSKAALPNLTLSAICLLPTVTLLAMLLSGVSGVPSVAQIGTTNLIFFKNYF